MTATTLSTDTALRTGRLARSFGAAVIDVVVGPPGLQRVHAAVSLMGVVVYLVFALIQAFEVAHGLIDRDASNLLTAFDVTGGLLFYAAVRSGLNRRVEADPSLAFSQCVFALLATSLSYAITGPARGAVLGIVLIILVFAMFSLPVVQIRVLAATAFGLLAAVMWWRSQTMPDRYAPIVEVTHAMFAVIIIGSIAILSARMAALRSRLKRQRTELSHALELNRRLATLDDLTGLVNRRHMTTGLHAEIERQRRHPGRMSVALIDIDLFKRINDHYGHATGDVVLQGFAKLAKDRMRGCDVIARWGGEEFLLLVPDVDHGDAIQAVDRLRVAFAGLEWPQAPGLRTTFSAGLATRFADENVDALVERADQCMYAAKSSGRNRIRDTDS